MDSFVLTLMARKLLFGLERVVVADLIDSLKVILVGRKDYWRSDS